MSDRNDLNLPTVKKAMQMMNLVLYALELEKRNAEIAKIEIVPN